MKEKDKNWGGARDGAGRHSSGRNVPLMVRITQEANDKLNRLTDNKSEYIDTLIKQQPEKIEMKVVTEGPKQITQKMLNEKLREVPNPIPITEELLNKNNFVRGEYTASYGHFAGYGSGCPDEYYVTYEIREDSLSVKVRFMNGHLHDIDICTKRYWMSSSKIKYVHELQTALTLCESDLKIIDEKQQPE